MKLIVLNITKYKENDAIIDGITVEGKVAFLAKGILSNKSRFSFLNNPLTIVDITFSEGNYKYPILKNADLVFAPRKVTENLDYLASLSLIQEMTRSLLPDDDKYLIFEQLELAIQSIKNENCPFLTVLIYMIQILKIAGFEFETNKCIYCNEKKDIVSFSFAEGGFICKNCIEKDSETSFSKNQLLLLHYICHKKDYISLPQDKISKSDQLILLKQFFTFIDDGLGIKLKAAYLFDL